jgi:hypothetical protein
MRRETKSELYTSRFLINGDDILFKATPSHMQAWRSNADDVGLIVNEIKTYITPQWFLINSIFGNKNGSIIRYYNRALAIGYRVKSEPIRLVSQASTIWNKEMKNLPEKCKSRFSRHFMKTLNKKMKPIFTRVRINNRSKFLPFTPNYFIQKKLGGLGLVSNKGFRKTKISYMQRKVATYLCRHPFESFLVEKINESPTSCKSAIQLFNKIKPSVQSWMLNGRPVHGPLNYYQCPDTIGNVYLEKCLSLKAWKLNSEPITDIHMIRYSVKKCMKSKERLISKREILKKTFRSVIFDTRMNIDTRCTNADQVPKLTEDFPDLENFWEL